MLLGTLFQLVLAAPLLLAELARFLPCGRSAAVLSATGWTTQIVGNFRKADGARSLMHDKALIASAPTIGEVTALRGDSATQITKCKFPHVSPASLDDKKSPAGEFMDPLGSY